MKITTNSDTIMALLNACKVVAWSEDTRKWLALHDPKALEQLDNALREAGQLKPDTVEEWDETKPDKPYTVEIFRSNGVQTVHCWNLEAAKRQFRVASVVGGCYRIVVYQWTKEHHWEIIKYWSSNANAKRTA